MIEDRHIREQLGFTEEIQMIDFSSLPPEEVASVFARVKNDITAAIYESALRLGHDPATFDDVAFLNSYDENDENYSLKQVLSRTIERLNWLKEWEAANLS